MGQVSLSADEALSAARIPENVQLFAERGVTATRESFAQMSAAAKGGAKLIEEIVSNAQGNTKAFGEKVIDNATKNADPLFAAAGAIARAKTFHEAATLHGDYLQKQFAIVSEQTKEPLELSKARAAIL